jgi:hypothetical protein
MLLNKNDYKKCKLEIIPHVVKRAVERNFPITKIRDIVFKGKWEPHILEERITCIYKNGTKYWTVILVPWKCHIFIITAFESNYSEIRMYKSLPR